MKKHVLAASMAVTALCGLSSSNTVQAGESFGLGNQSTFIPAIDFRPAFTPTCSLVFHGPGGYMHNPCGSAEIYYAPLMLPEGAQVYQYHAEEFDNGAGTIDTEFLRHGIVWSGGGTPTTDFGYGGTTLSSTDSANLQTISKGLTNFTFDSYDHTTSIHYTYAARLSLPATSNFAFRGMWVWYRRQLAPAPAVATFNDVPTGNAYFPYVEQLSRAGVTSGCGAGTFCPDQPVTRAQMAVFMSRALGLHWDLSTN